MSQEIDPKAARRVFEGTKMPNADLLLGKGGPLVALWSKPAQLKLAGGLYSAAWMRLTRPWSSGDSAGAR
jgi:hypothetical protein